MSETLTNMMTEARRVEEARTPGPWVSSVDFLKGRVQFVGRQSCAPFPSMLVVFGR